MDTPALTPETLAESSLGSPPTHAQTKPFEVPSSLHITMALENTSFFTTTTTTTTTATTTTTTAPLSPPESPFNFGAAFKPTARPTIVPAPASPQFQLPVRPRRKATSPEERPQTRCWSRTVQPKSKAQDNPYFPSIAEQERAERWKKDSARLPQPSPPLVPREHTPPTDDEVDSALPRGEELDAAQAELDWSLSPMERKRAMKIKLPETKPDEFPGSPESLPSSSAPQAVQYSADEYRRAMAKHLEEAMKRRQEFEKRRKMNAQTSSFQW